MKMATKIEINEQLLYPIMNQAEKLAILKRVKGIWKNKKPDPILELQKMRRGWERQLPELK